MTNGHCPIFVGVTCSAMAFYLLQELGVLSTRLEMQ